MDCRAPEYHADLADVDAAIARNYDEKRPQTRHPFLHLSMHLSISEQCGIDQRAASARQSNCWPSGSIRCTTPTTPPWNAWAEMLGKPALRPPPDGNATIAAIGTIHGTDFAQRMFPGALNKWAFCLRRTTKSARDSYMDVSRRARLGGVKVWFAVGYIRPVGQGARPAGP